jgi:hypothetical protein
MSRLGRLLDDVNSRNYRVTWSSTLEVPGLLLPSHRLLVLAADRSEDVLVDAVRDALASMTPTSVA